MVTIGPAEIAMMLPIQETVTSEDPVFLMKATFKAVEGTGRRGISHRVSPLHNATTHKVGVRWTTTKSGVLHPPIGAEGNRRRNGAKAGTTERTIVLKEIVAGKLTMAGNRANVIDIRTDGLQTAKTNLPRMNVPGSPDLVFGIVQNKGIATNVAVVGRK